MKIEIFSFKEVSKFRVKRQFMIALSKKEIRILYSNGSLGYKSSKFEITINVIDGEKTYIDFRNPLILINLIPEDIEIIQYQGLKLEGLLRNSKDLNLEWICLYHPKNPKVKKGAK